MHRLPPTPQTGGEGLCFFFSFGSEVPPEPQTSHRCRTPGQVPQLWNLIKGSPAVTQVGCRGLLKVLVPLTPFSRSLSVFLFAPLCRRIFIGIQVRTGGGEKREQTRNCELIVTRRKKKCTKEERSRKLLSLWEPARRSPQAAPPGRDGSGGTRSRPFLRCVSAITSLLFQMCQISARQEPFCCFHDTHTQFTLGWTSCGEAAALAGVGLFFFPFRSRVSLSTQLCVTLP